MMGFFCLSLAAEASIPQKRRNKSFSENQVVNLEIEHRIKKGDTLNEIAKKYGISPEEIKKQCKNVYKNGKVIILNDILRFAIQTTIPMESVKKRQEIKSQVQLLPKKRKKSNDKVTYHTVTEEETLPVIAYIYDVHVTDILRWNKKKLKSPAVNAGMILQVSPPVVPSFYEIKKGDTINAILRKFDLSDDHFFQLNTWLNKKSVIYPGQIVRFKKTGKGLVYAPKRLMEYYVSRGYVKKSDAIRIAIAIEKGIQKTLFDDYAFVAATINAESDWDIKAKSPKGAIGLCQIIPNTGKKLGIDIHNLEENVYGGIKYLKQLSEMFNGDKRLISAAYNYGPDRVKKLGRVPRWPETEKYVEEVMRLYKKYKKEGGILLKV